MQVAHKIHWKAPVVMVATYVSGLLSALGHHFFYNNLNGTVAHDNSNTPNSTILEQWSMDGQKFNITIGTALAFLVSASLGAAVSTAYTQVAWQSIKQQSRTMATIDAIFAILGSPLAFFNAFLWLRLPVLTLLAVTFWLIPLASVVTPGTLRVFLANTTQYSPEVVPAIDWTSINFASIVPALDNSNWAIEGVYDVSQPGYAVQHVFQTASLVGSIASLTAPGPNTAWSLDFSGPEMRCSNVSLSFEERIIADVLDHMTTSDTCGTIWGYLGWQGDEDEPVPFHGDRHTVRRPTKATDDIYIAVFPKLMEPVTQNWETIFKAACDEQDFYRNAMNERTVMRCATFNVSYHLDIKFTDGIQHINSEVSRTDDRFGLITNISDPDPLMVPGTHQYNLTLVQNIAFQSVVGVFQGMLLGSIAAYAGQNHTLTTRDTTVRDTVLRGCKELMPIQEHEDSNFNRWFQGKYNSISNTEPSRADFPLPRQLEELFRNVTISLMSMPDLQPNTSSPYAPPLTEVAFTKAQNVFVYSASTLWLAYGLALFISFLCVVLGLFSVLRSRSSFTTQFSTILRASRGAELSVEIQDRDFRGQDPLPKYMEAMNVDFPDPVGLRPSESSLNGPRTRHKGEPEVELARMPMLRGTSSTEN